MKEQIEAVQRMQDYIAEHLTENITLAALAEASYFSPWYSYRLFLQQTNLTPADYIRRSRLSRAALKLRDEQCKVIDIALEFGFGSVDGYQRAFFREFGCNPSEYSKSPIPLYLFTPYGVKYRQLRGEKQMEIVKNVFVQVIEKPERKVLIKRGVKATESFCQSNNANKLDSVKNCPACLYHSRLLNSRAQCGCIVKLRPAIYIANSHYATAKHLA